MDELLGVLNYASEHIPIVRDWTIPAATVLGRLRSILNASKAFLYRIEWNESEAVLAENRINFGLLNGDGRPVKAGCHKFPLDERRTTAFSRLFKGDVVSLTAGRDGAPSNILPSEWRSASAILVPVKTDAGVWGFIGFASEDANYQIDELNLKVLRTISSIIGFAIRAACCSYKSMYDKLFLNSSNPICITDEKGALTEANPAFIEMVDYPEKGEIKKTIFDYLHPQDVDEARAKAGRAFEDVVIKPVMSRILCRNNVYRWFSWSLMHMADHGRVYIMGRDVTEVKLAQDVLAENEARHRLLLEASPDPIASFDMLGNVLFTNEAFALTYGGMNDENEMPLLLTANGGRMNLNGVIDALNGSRIRRFEAKCSTAEGNWLDVQVSASVFFDYTGRAAGAIIILRDITERKQIETSLWESEERLTRIIDNMPVLMDAFDADGNIIFWNRECERVTGYSAHEMVGNPDAVKLLYPDDDYRYKVLASWHLMGDDFSCFEVDLTCKDGTKRTVSWSNCALKAPIPGWASWAAGMDVTRNKEAERRLRRSEAMFRALTESAVTGVLIIEDGKIIYANPEAKKIAGRTGVSICPESYFEFIHADSEREVLKLKEAASSGTGDFKRVEIRIKTPDGRTRWIDFGLRGVHFGGKKVLLGNFFDITDKKHTLEALKESELRYRQQFEIKLAKKMVVDPETMRIIEANQAACDFYGYSEDQLADLRITDITQAKISDLKRAMETALRGSGDPVQFKHRLADGAIRDVHVFSAPVTVNGKTCLYMVVHDVTERLNNEKALQDSLKEKEILIQEIHHRVKNNMQVIWSLLGLQLDGARHEETVEKLMDGQTRIQAMALVHEILYSSDNFSSVDLKTYSLGLINALSCRFPDVCRRVDFDILTDGIGLSLNEAVPCGFILNELLTNSMKFGFPDNRKGVIRIRAEADGDWIVISVTDDGRGLPDGFSITGAEGLGLKLVKGLVEKQLKGALQLVCGKGANFVFKFKPGGS